MWSRAPQVRIAVSSVACPAYDPDVRPEPVVIRRLGPDEVATVLAAAHLFDHEPRAEWASAVLRREGHHLLIASVDGTPVGFATGIEALHPDKGVEILLYELGVDEAHRRRGIGRALTSRMLALAEEIGGYGMWVPVEPGNDPAVATYRSAGSGEPEEAIILTWSLEG